MMGLMLMMKERKVEQANLIAAALERIRLARNSGSDSENEDGNPDDNDDHHTSSSSASSEQSSEDEGDDENFDYLR